MNDTLMVIQRDEFFTAISDLKATQREMKAEHRETRDELMSITRETRDLLQKQNGKVNTTVTDVAVLKEQFNTLSSSVKDGTARWLAIAGIVIAALIEVLRYVATHAKVP